jgi:hypothetical protein
VYFPGFGWIPFDPTPNRGQLTAAYTPFSPAFDVRDAAGPGSALQGVPEIRAQLEGASGLGPTQGPSGTGAGTGGVPSAVADAGRSILTPVLLVLGGAVAALVLVKEARRRARFVARDPRALAAAYRRDLVGFLVDQGHEVPASATVRDLGELVERRFGVNSAPFVAALTAARYGPPREARARVSSARSELRRLRRRMSRDLGVVQRVRGALSLRSLTA